jgi:ketosteroid isomerase-like protein
MTTKRSLLWGSLALAIMATGVAAPALAADTDEQAVKNGELEWLKAQQTNNVDLVAPLLADKIVETNGEGKVFNGKDAVLADAKTQTWSSVEYKDLKVTVFGHTAIATGTFVGKGTMGGKTLDLHERFTDTWVKMDGKWLCVASHDSGIKM